MACALLWQQPASEPISLATFDEQLWLAAQKAGLAVWPETLDHPAELPRDDPVKRPPD